MSRFVFYCGTIEEGNFITRNVRAKISAEHKIVVCNIRQENNE
jgi:hypothetical protein